MPSPPTKLEVSAQVGLSSTAKELRDELRAQLINYDIELRPSGIRGNADVPWEVFVLQASVSLTTQAIVGIVRIASGWARRRLRKESKLEHVEIVLLGPDGEALRVVRVPKSIGGSHEVAPRLGRRTHREEH